MATCKACGCPIKWAVTANGSRIPLDARAVVYQVVTENSDPMSDAAPIERAVRASGHYVSHFATCPKASQFSRAGAAAETKRR